MIAQIIAIVIFVIMFALIIIDKIERHKVTLVSACATLILVFGLCLHNAGAAIDTINVRTIFTPDFWYHTGTAEEITTGINWATIFFIAGMMVMVEGMAHNGFFRWLCLMIAKIVRYKAIPIFMTFMLLSAVLSMFIDSITVILFLAAVTVELAHLLKFNPVPMILAEIFCANLGGSATMCGDPPNIIIGTSLGYTFMDFLTNTGVFAGISLVVIMIYFYFLFRKELLQNTGDDLKTINYPNPAEVITDKTGFIISCIIFGMAVILLITHAQTGLTVAFIGIFIAVITLITSFKNCLALLKKVDYKTLLFFVGLFVVIGGLEQTGVLEIIASAIKHISGGNIMLMVAIIIWVSAIASAFIDNIPFAATMIPVINDLAGGSAMLPVLAWALSMGTDIGGSATPIGASANVVGTSVASKEGHPITWRMYCSKLVIPTVIVLIISTVGIWIRYL